MVVMLLLTVNDKEALGKGCEEKEGCCTFLPVKLKREAKFVRE
jgi:hypothetical protein